MMDILTSPSINRVKFAQIRLYRFIYHFQANRMISYIYKEIRHPLLPLNFIQAHGIVLHWVDGNCPFEHKITQSNMSKCLIFGYANTLYFRLFLKGGLSKWYHSIHLDSVYCPFYRCCYIIIFMITVVRVKLSLSLIDLFIIKAFCTPELRKSINI